MKKLYLVTFLLLTWIAGHGQVGNYPVQKLDFRHFEPYLHQNNDTLYVVNFWASWCIPCREELPAFEKINQKYEGKKVKVLLVSLDFPNELNSRLVPFLRKNQIKSEVILLDDPKQNEWIDKVEPKWSGALPFTQLYQGNFRQSYERSFQISELDSLINLKINKL